MLPLLKKTADRPSQAQSGWHPDFRNAEHLPDIKAVRTTFFINGMAVLLAVILVIYALYAEVSMNVLRGSVADWEQIIKDNKPSSDAAIARFKKFQAEELKLKDAEALLPSPLVFSDLVFHLGATLPENVLLNGIEYRSTGVNLAGVVRGSPELASGFVTLYVDQLRADPVLKKIFAEVELSNMSRNAAAEMINMEIALKFPVPAQPSKKK